MKESIFDKILREMRLRQIKPHLNEFENLRLLMWAVDGRRGC